MISRAAMNQRSSQVASYRASRPAATCVWSSRTPWPLVRPSFHDRARRPSGPRSSARICPAARSAAARYRSPRSLPGPRALEASGSGPEDHRAVRERREHQPVPGRDRLVVTGGLGAVAHAPPAAALVSARAVRPHQPRSMPWMRAISASTRIRDRIVRPSKFPAARDAVRVGEDRRVRRSEHGVDLGRRPDVGQAFFAVGVRVLARGPQAVAQSSSRAARSRACRSATSR